MSKTRLIIIYTDISDININDIISIELEGLNKQTIIDIIDKVIIIIISGWITKLSIIISKFLIYIILLC